MTGRETVAAVSTPYGKGGVALIRVSGEDAVAICDRVFKRAAGTLADAPAREALYGSFVRDGEIIDTGLATVFRAPASFTGEDVVELSCHGGILVTETVLGAVLAAGAEPAPAGEFTKRAFLSGKLSLSAAEAVADIIDAHSPEMLRLSGANARGALAKELDTLHERLQSVIASCYVDADFPDEELSDMSSEEMLAAFSELLADTERLCATYRTGKAVREGIDTVIAGKPNTGKSSLLNMLCGAERAIVTDIAGTTRDILEEKVVVGKVTLNLCDTAGIRATRSRVEKIGVERAKERIDHAELVLAVFDASAPLDRYDAKIIESIRALKAAKIAVINKTDLQKKMDPYQLDNVFDKVLYISCATGDGKDELFAEIEALYTDGKIDYDTTAVVANARLYAALSGTAQALRTACEALRAGQSPDIAAIEGELALSRLSEGDGRAVADGIVDEIFHRFCVGK